MAGSISLSLSQQFDELGKPLSGGLLYFIQAGTTSTPQDSFKDTGLTLAHPYPITLDAAGRVPAFYLADGQVKVRLLSSAGVEQIVQDNLLVIGPSSGGGGGGGQVDATTIFQTGDCLWLDVSGTRDGWVRDNGRTLGSALSGATERANSDTQALFIYLWNTYADSVCPVSTGRGASGLADFQANKTIQLPDKRGYIPGGLDDMGNSAAGRYANVPVISGSVTAAGSVIGETLHTTLVAELPASPTTGTITNGAITNTVSGGTVGYTSAANAASFGTAIGVPTGAANIAVASSQAASTFTGANLGSGTAHNNVQKTVLGSFFRKL